MTEELLRRTARRRLRDELDRLASVRAALVGEALDQETEAQSVGELSSSRGRHPTATFGG